MTVQSKRPTQAEIDYSKRCKAVRRGEYDDIIFLMRGGDASYRQIAKKLRVFHGDVVNRVNKIYKQFREPEDQIERSPYYG